MKLTGNAKADFLKWFKEEKLMTEFDDYGYMVRQFLIMEWLDIVGLKISTIHNFITDKFRYVIKTNSGDYSQNDFNTRGQVTESAIECANDVYNLNER